MENSRFIAFMILTSFQTILTANQDASYYKEEIHVGVILDLGSWAGKVINRCVTKGISDFYTANPHYRTRIVVNTRNTKGEPLLVSSAALDLLQNNKVQAIIGPHSTTEARFLKSFMAFKEADYNNIWAYDAIYALAMTLERAHTEKYVTNLALLNRILRSKFHAFGCEFKFMNKRTISKAIEAANPLGQGDKRVGFWMANGEFVKDSSSNINGLENIIFPGGITTIIPNHRRLLMNGKKMRILVPISGFPNLVQLGVDPRTNLPIVSGFCGDVFIAAFNALNYKVDIEFVPYHHKKGRTYNDMIDKVHSKEFDAAIGDITITPNRSRYVDFTLPFSDMGIGTLVRNTNNKSMWIFLNPLSADLWLTSASFFLVMGFVVWFIEHRTNKEFQGSTRQQIGTTLWFAYSTLVYAHREKLESNLSRFVVTVWVFVVLVLTSSYTATLSSLLTVQQIASKGRSLEFHPGGGVGVYDFKLNDGIKVNLHSPDRYAKALRSGSVGSITDEILYIKSFLALYSGPDFSLVATASTTNGFAFVFQKGSPLTLEMSIQIAKLREDGTLKALEDKWLKLQSSTMSEDFSAVPPKILNLYGLRGLFLVSGVSMALALLVSMVCLAREKCQGKSKMEVLRCIFTLSTCTR